MSRIIMNMDRDWRFFRGEPIADEGGNSHSSDYAAAKAGSARGPAGKIWGDGEWREVDLPHDYYAESEMAAENRHSH